MSTEKIIERIQNDAQKQIQQIIDDAEKQSRMIVEEAKAEAEKEAKSILRSEQLESENTKKIMVSKATQDVRKDMMNAKEEIIEHCFTQAMQSLASFPDDQYQKLILRLLQTGKKRLGANATMTVSRAIDREIAKQEGIPIQGTVKSIGGIIFQSHDGKITIDNTFERILSRKKDELRIHVGKLLFPS
jgi:vacuolar-type H+-ATPase subunit E/Vma4